MIIINLEEKLSFIIFLNLLFKNMEKYIIILIKLFSYNIYIIFLFINDYYFSQLFIIYE